MAKKFDADAMTGAEFAELRTTVFEKTQAEMAELLGLGLRTVIRFEGTAMRERTVPLPHAKHVRCKVRDLKAGR